MKAIKNKEYYIDMLSHKKIRNWKDEIAIKTALSLLEDVEDADIENVKTEDDLLTVLLNGADSWEEYSKTGCFLIYSEDIATWFFPDDKKRVKAITKGEDYLFKIQADFLRTAAFQIRSAFLYGNRYIKK